MPVVLDLDGVLWRGHEPVPGSAEAVLALRSAGVRVGFVTNNGFVRRADVAARLAAAGVEAGDDLLTAPMAAAGMLPPGSRVLLCGGPGAREALEARGVCIEEPADTTVAKVTADPPDAVVVSLHLDVDYHRIAVAAAAVRAGARFVATNDDATFPAADGLYPGAGAVVAAVERAAGSTAEVAGKPNAPIAALVRGRFGDRGWVVGDRLDTDGALARVLGWSFALVLSGVTGPGGATSGVPGGVPDVVPDVVADDLAALVASGALAGA